MLILVAVWASAEALLLFIVADLPVSFVAVRHGFRRGALAALVAALAAAAGGAAAYAWARADAAGFRGAMIALPALDAAMIEANTDTFARQGYPAMLSGSLSGVPYKIYAYAAAVQSRDLIGFLLVSPFVRLPRFLLSAAVAAAISHLLSRRLALRPRMIILGCVWVAFYLFYFISMPG